MDTWIHEKAHQYYIESLEEEGIRHKPGNVYYGDDGKYYQILLNIPCWKSPKCLHLVKIGFILKIKINHCYECHHCHSCLTEGIGGCPLKQYI